MKMWVIKSGIKNFFNYIKRPYYTIRPQNDRDWHVHICIPLRLGKECFEYACPYANEKNFDTEGDIRCDYCTHFKILDSPSENSVRIV